MFAKKFKRKSMIAPWGFTLVELIVTLAIMAIAAGIAYPMLQRYAINGNLKTATRDISSDFARLKESAMAEMRMYQMQINTGNNTITLQQCNAQGSPCAGLWTPTQVKNLSGYANDIVFDASTAPTNYTFQTRGTVNMGTIVLRNSRNSTATIRINITGRTNVQFNMQ